MAKAVKKINEDLGQKIYYKVDKTGADDELYDDKTIHNAKQIDEIPDGYSIIGGTAFAFAMEAAKNIVGG